MSRSKKCYYCPTPTAMLHQMRTMPLHRRAMSAQSIKRSLSHVPLYRRNRIQNLTTSPRGCVLHVFITANDGTNLQIIALLLCIATTAIAISTLALSVPGLLLVCIKPTRIHICSVDWSHHHSSCVDIGAAQRRRCCRRVSGDSRRTQQYGTQYGSLRVIFSCQCDRFRVRYMSCIRSRAVFTCAMASATFSYKRRDGWRSNGRLYGARRSRVSEL